jgi:hypothetical protein
MADMTIYRIAGNIVEGWTVSERRGWWPFWRKIGARSHMDQALRDLVPDKETGFSKLFAAAKRGER